MNLPRALKCNCWVMNCTLHIKIHTWLLGWCYCSYGQLLRISSVWYDWTYNTLRNRGTWFIKQTGLKITTRWNTNNKCINIYSCQRNRSAPLIQLVSVWWLKWIWWECIIAASYYKLNCASSRYIGGFTMKFAWQI